MTESSVDPGFDALSYHSEPHRPPVRAHEDAARALWCAVIRQALIDLSVMAGSAHDTERRQAERWFFQANNAYSFVCHMAGVHPETIRKAARLVQEGKIALFLQQPGRRQ